jgi:hypothetical protein
MLKFYAAYTSPDETYYATKRYSPRRHQAPSLLSPATGRCKRGELSNFLVELVPRCASSSFDLHVPLHFLDERVVGHFGKMNVAVNLLLA